MCEVVDVSRSGYPYWRSRSASREERADTQFTKEIRRIFKESRQTYGYERNWRALQAEGTPGGKHRVRRLMRQEGFVVKQVKRCKRTI